MRLSSLFMFLSHEDSVGCNLSGGGRMREEDAGVAWRRERQLL
jgi:hypothetical protein